MLILAEHGGQPRHPLELVTHHVPGVAGFKTPWRRVFTLSDTDPESVIEALLASMVQAQDVQALYAAQGATKAKLKRLKAAAG